MLTDHQSALIDGLVASGRYQNASEALRAGLRLLKAEEAARRALVGRIDGAVADYRRAGALDEDGASTIRRVFDRARDGAGPGPDGG